MSESTSHAKYTIVDEAYVVDVFSSLKKLVEFYSIVGMFDENGMRLSTTSIREQLKENGVSYAYEENTNDWKYKIQLHNWKYKIRNW